MAKSRYIQDSFWTDPYVEKLDPSEKLLFIYFLTNPLCNIAGMYEIRNTRIAYETGFDKDMIDRIKERFVRDGKMLVVDDWVIIVNFVKHQSTNPSVLVGIQRVINELPYKVRQVLTACDSLSYFTLLNLTLLNLTLPNANAEGSNPQPNSQGDRTNEAVTVVSNKKQDEPVNPQGEETNEVLTVVDWRSDAALWKSKTLEKLEEQSGSNKYNLFFERELNNFISYWTEKSPNGRKERWQLEKVFDPNRRLGTWIKRAQTFQKLEIQKLEIIKKDKYKIGEV